MLIQLKGVATNSIKDTFWQTAFFKLVGITDTPTKTAFTNMYNSLVTAGYWKKVKIMPLWGTSIATVTVCFDENLTQMTYDVAQTGEQGKAGHFPGNGFIPDLRTSTTSQVDRIFLHTPKYYLQTDLNAPLSLSAWNLTAGNAPGDAVGDDWLLGAVGVAQLTATQTNAGSYVMGLTRNAGNAANNNATEGFASTIQAGKSGLNTPGNPNNLTYDTNSSKTGLLQLSFDPASGRRVLYDNSTLVNEATVNTTINPAFPTVTDGVQLNIGSMAQLGSNRYTTKATIGFASYGQLGPNDLVPFYNIIYTFMLAVGRISS